MFQLLRMFGLIRRSDMHILLAERQSKIVQLRKQIKVLEGRLSVRSKTSVVTGGRKER